MALTKYTASTDIIQALADLPNATSGLTATQLKAKFDENPAAFKAFVNSLIDQLESIVDGTSGADNIGATAIAGLTGGTVQSLLESLNTLKATLASPTFTGTVVLPSATSIGTVTSTEIGYLDNVTSSIQTQLNAKQALDATLTALAAFNTNGLIKQTAADTFTAVVAPTGAVVGDSDVQTLSNKTLMAPEFGTSGYIADANGNELIKFPATVVSAVNEVTITNTATLGKPSISATGGDINISLDLISKGAGTVQANSVDIVTTTGTQTLTNKSISGGQISSAVANATNAALAANVTTNANLTGDITSVGNATAIAAGVIVNADINASAAIDASKIANGLVSNAEFQYLDGVTSGIQTQINNVVLGQIPDNSLTNIKLATDIKVGSLAALTTTDKSSVVAAVNEVVTLKAPLASPALAGTPTAPTAAVDTTTTQLATTAFVTNQASAVAPLMDGVATVGVSKRYARQDHIHPDDTSKADVASPALTGTPTAPTAAAGTSTTQLATTAFVTTADNLKATKAVVASDDLLTTTAQTTIATFTPTAQGNFLIGIYFRVSTGTTNVTVQVTYADGSGAQTNTMINAQVSAIGSYSLVPLFINAVSGTAIAVKVTASVANQVYASASVVGV